MPSVRWGVPKAEINFYHKMSFSDITVYVPHNLSPEKNYVIDAQFNPYGRGYVYIYISEEKNATDTSY